MYEDAAVPNEKRGDESDTRIPGKKKRRRSAIKRTTPRSASAMLRPGERNLGLRENCVLIDEDIAPDARVFRDDARAAHDRRQWV